MQTKMSVKISLPAASYFLYVVIGADILIY